MNAIALNSVRPAKPPATEPIQYLTFLLAGEMFAIGILAIKEIIEHRDLTVVPMMPASVRGVLNLRGAVVPVIDLLARFGKAPGEIGRRSCFVVVELAIDGEPQVVGLLVDSVCEVLDIAPTDIEPPPSFGLNLRSDFMHGMGKVRDKFVILLDVDRVMDPAALETLADAIDMDMPFAS